ncbi:ATP-grasp domain-containing protein [uncultured Christiangramia sp.]|uniref:ATP-grasp domain-containing protein n=1 Tax=Christiangramia sp. 3-2217-3z TaxID=3417564 RepID=UPI00263652C6|nr:ATP-grasp domain-containing protein [uncultured Christiangramia sp.]
MKAGMKKIAILGASYLQLPLVQKAKELGYETHCFAWDNTEAVCKNVADYFYPISVLDKESILLECEKVQIDGIITIATDICIPTISFVAEKLDLIANSSESAYISTHKLEMKNAFLKNNIKTPKIISFSNAGQGFTNQLKFPLIVKPTDRSGSRGVSKVNTQIELLNAIEIAKEVSIEKKVLVEEFVEGTEVSVESISWKGEHYILAITDKVTTGEPHFVELEHHQPSTLSESILGNIRDETLKALDALDIKFGASHSEFKITRKDEIFLIEVGARMGGDFIGSHLVELSTGYDYLAGVIGISLNYFKEPKVEKKGSSGIYFLTANNAYLQKYFTYTHSFEVLKNRSKKDLVYPSNSNDRSGYFIYHDNHRKILK